MLALMQVSAASMAISEDAFRNVRSFWRLDLPIKPEPNEGSHSMEKKRKKKAVGAVGKSAGKPSEYKAIESEGKTKKTEGQFQKVFGKAKIAPRKG